MSALARTKMFEIGRGKEYVASLLFALRAHCKRGRLRSSRDSASVGAGCGTHGLQISAQRLALRPWLVMIAVTFLILMAAKSRSFSPSGCLIRYPNLSLRNGARKQPVKARKER